ncbi:MAG: tRNA (adenosine(37)-N6)-threonylcarbamoyltransferase complex transferase subunit TsaD [Bacteroidota bacterium]|nr:tRNA (adenosine(37)-N6)-threonylcarbamoyltransferase complex transferase subunit TsaD [Bacteroidota bacterium]MDX5449398.1 tRNA (adenosine(37)-N6)-threonylcarbamoyltransferase complex transferase subunit TsaD [Bacteroidota bacterium]
MERPVHILAIESSCDDTSAAVLRGRKVLSNLVAGQEVHSEYGGVVPELASREHQKNIVPVVHQALKVANIAPQDLDSIAFTSGPGLMGSLLVGSSFAKSLSIGLNIPLIDVHHMHAHVLAHFIENEERNYPSFPFICLTVSGGHTQLVLVRDHDDMDVIGQTIDDAAGEAFDKTAKILGLPYPGGPQIDRLAAMGNPNSIQFGKPQIPDLDYSFSGLKTSILYTLRDLQKEDPDLIKNRLEDICASVQRSILDILFDKLIKAMELHSIHEVAIAGGVSANSGLRQRLREESERRGWNHYIPPFEYTTDNAAMIGIAGYYKFLKGQFADSSTKANARLKF